MFAIASKSLMRVLSVLGLVVASATVTAAAVTPDTKIGKTSAPSSTQAAETYGKLPLSFEANQGQAGSSVQFLSRGSGYSLFLTGNSAVLALGSPSGCRAPNSPPAEANAKSTPCPAGASPREDIVRMTLAGAATDRRSLKPQGEAPLPGKVNYFLGNDPSMWRTDLPTYAKVRYAGVYDGIDLVYYGNQRQLEYDFVVAPGADPAKIRMNFSGQEHLTLGANGDLILKGADGEATFHKPVVYQEIGGRRRTVPGSFDIAANRTVSFRVGSYDHSRRLVIDPVLVYSTYLGGSTNDRGNGIAVDSAGNAYVVGTTFSTDFPTTGEAFQSTNNAALAGHGGTVFVTKVDPTGTALIYSTFLGGSGSASGGDFGYGIALDPANNVYVTGATYSSNFPVTCGAYQTANPSTTAGATTGFVTKLNPASDTLLYSTYLGGAGNQSSPADGDVSQAIAVNSAGNAYLTGYTWSNNFPVSDGAFQSTFAGSATISNGFVTELNTAGSALVYSTYLGGAGSFGIGDYSNAIALDSSGDAFVTGSAGSSNFPVTAGAFQGVNNAASYGDPTAFVTELNPTGTEEVFSTYLGGSGSATPAEVLYTGDVALAIAVDNAGFVYVAGNTSSYNFPITAGALEQTDYFSNGPAGFVTKFNKAGSSLEYSTFLEGTSTSVTGLAVDGNGAAYIAGSAPAVSLGALGGFVVTPDALATPTSTADSAFLVKLSPSATVLNYATLFGGSSNDQATALALDSAGNAYLTGFASSTNFPATNGAFQAANKAAATNGSNAFVSKFSLAAENNQTTYPVLPSSIGTTLTDVGPDSLTEECYPDGDSGSDSWTMNVTVNFQASASGPPPGGMILFEDSGGAACTNPNPFAPNQCTAYPPANGSGGFSFQDGESFDAPWGPFSVPWFVSYSGDGLYAPSSVSGTVSVSPGCPAPSGDSIPFTAARPQIHLKIRGTAEKTPSKLATQWLSAKWGVSGPKFTPSPINSSANGRRLQPAAESRLVAQATPACIAPKPSLTVTVLPAAGSRLYGAANPKFTYTVAGLLNGDTVTVTPSTTATSASDVGSYPVSAVVTGAAAANYSIYVTDGTLTVTPAPLTVNIHGNWKIYGSANPSFTVTTSGLLNGDTVTVTPQTAATAASPVGSYPVTATVTGPAAANYTINLTPATLDVFKALLHVAAANAGVTYGQTPVQPTGYSITGFVNGDTAAVVSGAPALSTAVTSQTPAGVYPITVGVNNLSAANYDFTNTSSGEGAMFVYKAQLLATANNQTMVEGGPIPALTYTLSGFVNGDSAATAVTGAPDMFTTATVTSPPGRYVISGNLGTLASHNYSFTRVTGVMTVIP